MSSFICEYCGEEIMDTENGYITECEHYPIEERMASNKMDKISSILERIREHSGWIYNTTETLSIYINEANYNEALLEIRDMKTMSQKMEILIDKLAKEIEKRNFLI